MIAFDTSSEAHRHSCEIRHCIRQGYAWFAEYIKGVRLKRGDEAAKRLWDDVKAQSAKSA